MKSKISFFNKTIFWKNVSLYWPIWGIYTLGVFIYQPIMLWVVAESSKGFSDYGKDRLLSDLMTGLRFEPYIWLIALCAVVSGMALYSYLYNSKSANMIHALPVDRTQLFGTTLISGWSFLIVPLFAAAFMTSIICLAYGIPGIGYVWLWFLAVAAIAIIAFSIVTICAMFTGHIVVLPMYVVVVNYFSWIVYYLFSLVITTFGHGVIELSNRAYALANTFSPLHCFYRSVRLKPVYSESGNIIDVELLGLPYILMYLVIALVLYVVAYIIYRKRKIEQAGDFLTVNWVKPIFRVAVGIVGAIFVAMFIREVLIDIGIGCSVLVFVVMMILVGAICYFAADMFIKKSFHVFQKKDWMRCGIFTGILLVFFLGLYGLSEQYENYLPEASKVKTARVDLGYNITLEGEDVKEALEIHSILLEELDAIEAEIESGNRYHNTMYISYTLENGETISRRYSLPVEVASIRPAIEKALALEMKEDNFLLYLFQKDYDQVEVFEGGYFEASIMKGEDRVGIDGFPNTAYDTFTLDPEQAKLLYEAAIADVKAGTLMKYNVITYKYEDMGYVEDTYVKSTDASICLEYALPESAREEYNKSDKAPGFYYEEIKYDSSIYEDEYGIPHYTAFFSFGPDCENIINALIKCGFIDSVEDVWWSMAEDLLK